MLFWFTVIETLTGRLWLTIMVTVLDVAGLPEVHERLEVMTT
jgi:hypothetical protein